MGLRLILGRAGSGKTEQCMQEITGELRRAPRGMPLIFIVPEQATFQTEYNLATRRGLGGTIRAQVLSFRRLAWRVLQEQGGRDRFFIDDTGKSMLLRRIIENRKNQLRIFHGAGEQAGGIENLVQLYNELKRSGISMGRFKKTIEDRGLQENDAKESARQAERGDVETPERLNHPAKLNHSDRFSLPLLKSSSFFRYKMQDLLVLFQELEREVESRFLDAEDTLTVLELGIPSSAYVQEARVWVDGFYGFTNQEYGVLEALLGRCRDVAVTVVLDEHVPPHAPIDELDPFFPAALTCRQLHQRAARAGIPVKIQHLRPEKTHRFASSPALEHLERHLRDYPPPQWTPAEEPIKKPAEEAKELTGSTVEECAEELMEESTAGITKKTLKETGIRLISAANRRCEVEAAARSIIALARDRGYRWRDMAVITGDPEAYEDLVRTLFEDYEIPYFLDRARPVLHHPLVEFLRSALDVIVHNWRYDAVFRCIKTDVLFPMPRAGKGTHYWRERADRLENYVLAFGIQGQNRWQEAHWPYLEVETLEDLDKGDEREEKGLTQGQKRFLEDINQTRETLSAPLLTFQQDMGQAETVQEKARALYSLIERIKAPRRLEDMIQTGAAQGMPEKVREHQQVFDSVMDLLDQLVETMGDEKVNTPLFARLLETGMENMRLNLVPPSLDQVLVGNVDRTRVSQVRCAFILGVNDGCLPSRPPEDRVFTEEERETLIGWGLELAPGSRRRLLDEQFLVYTALTRASGELWLSYALANEEGQGLVPSLLIDRLKELFPWLEEKTVEPEPAVTLEPAPAAPLEPEPAVTVEPAPASVAAAEAATSFSDGALERPAPSTGDDALDAWTPLSYVARPRCTLAHTAVQLGEAQKKGTLDPLWRDVYNWFARESPWRETAGRFLRGVQFNNREKPLNGDTALALFGQPLRAGVSRLEKHRACPFAHFAAYGLRLKERRIYRLEAPDIGRFFHVILRNLALELKDQGKDWPDLTPEDCRQKAQNQVEQLAPRLQKEILLSSNRYQHLSRKLAETVQRAVYYLGEHARRGSFRTAGVEVEFGPGKTLPEPPVDLGNGIALEMVGRVDRIDLARNEEKTRDYVRIIDYKSGPTRLDLQEVYHGLSLQMLIYLDVVLRSLPDWLGLEARPAAILYYPLRAPLLSCDAPPDDKTLQAELLKQYKMQGRLLADPDVIRMMDNLLKSGNSPILPVGIKASGDFYQKAAVLQETDFERLRAHARSLAVETARAVYAGDVDIQPYRLGQKTACRYCPYRPVCQFDPGLEDNNYRIISADSEEDILQRLQAQQAQHVQYEVREVLE